MTSIYTQIYLFTVCLLTKTNGPHNTFEMESSSPSSLGGIGRDVYNHGRVFSISSWSGEHCGWTDGIVGMFKDINCMELLFTLNIQC